MKINVDENVIHGTIEIGSEKMHYKAYPATLEISLLILEAQENEDDKKMLLAYSKYFDECVEFAGFGAKRIKERAKQALERSGKFIEFINEVFTKLGKQREPKD